MLAVALVVAAAAATATASSAATPPTPTPPVPGMAAAVKDAPWRLALTTVYGGRWDRLASGAWVEGRERPALVDPRSGRVLRLAATNANDPAGTRALPSGWRWGAALQWGRLQVPFHESGEALGGPWMPERLGLRSPGAPAEWAIEAAWLEYGGTMRFPDPQARWVVWAGRRPPGFGAGTGLAPAPLAPGVDQVGGAWQWEWVTYRKSVGRLEPGERYLLTHQLDLGPWATPWGGLSLVVYEVGVVSERFARLPFTWIPLWPGYLTQALNDKFKWGLFENNANDDANFYMGAGGRWEQPFGWPVVLDGEVLVDDMPQVPWARNQPYQLGGSLGVHTGALSVRYTRTYNFVITFQQRELSLVQNGQLLAYPDGPDTDSLRVDWHPAGRWVGAGEWRLLRLGLEFRRRGPGRIGDVWENNISREEAIRREFLGQPGPVEHALLAHLAVNRAGREAGGALFDQAPPTVELTLGPVWNAANRPGQDGFLARLAIQLPLR